MSFLRAAADQMKRKKVLFMTDFQTSEIKCGNMMKEGKKKQKKINNEFSIIVHEEKQCWKNYERTDSQLKISGATNRSFGLIIKNL
jgi:hypothetical protein